MFNRFTKYTLCGREFKLVFTLAAMQQIIDKYGSVQAISEIQERVNAAEDIPDDADEQMRATLLRDVAAAQSEAMGMIPWLFATLANQGAWIDNGGKQPADLITPEWAAVNIMPGDIKGLMKACNQAMVLGMSTEHQKGDGEVVDVVLEELQRDEKNSTGAGQ